MGLTTDVKASAAGENGAVQWNDNGTLSGDPGTNRSTPILWIDNTAGAGNQKVIIGATGTVASDSVLIQVRDRFNATNLGYSSTIPSMYLGNGINPVASCILSCTSTTQAFRPPIMTTAQKNAIGTPSAGMMVFDTDLSKLCVYSGAAWRTVTDT